MLDSFDIYLIKLLKLNGCFGLSAWFDSTTLFLLDSVWAALREEERPLG